MFSKEIFSINEISEKYLDKNITLVHAGNAANSDRVTALLSRKSGSWQIYTAFNVFPYSRYGRFLGSKDLLVTSFSNTPESVKSLVQAVVSQQLPDRGEIKYKP